ncbi:MAG: cytochrome c peroxidase [Litorimonas sp.]
MNKIIPLSLTAALLLSACGGGGATVTPATPVADVNQAPVTAVSNSDQTAVVNAAFDYDATQGSTTFTDADGDALSYSVSYSPAANGLTDAAGVISGIPTTEGTITVTITADDGNGGTVSNSFDIVVDPEPTDQNAVMATFGGRINLDALEAYAAQSAPNYITKLNDGGNPITDAGATLGRVLFYDPALSIDDTISCSSCHVQSAGFSDLAVVSDGVEGGVTGRHSMRLINTQFANETNFFWDERASSHENQETQPLQDANEHGFSGVAGRPGLADLITKLEALEYYQELFTFVYGDAEITEERLQLALAQFTKSIWSFDSRYDEGLAQTNNLAADFPNLTADENAGKRLFMQTPANGGGGCQGCHIAPEFDIRQGSGHNGVVGVAGSPGEFDFTNTRSPSLRDLVDPDGNPNGPMMHDGSLPTLLDVVDHYNDIAVPADAAVRQQFLNTIDNRLRNGGNGQELNFTEAQKAQLVAFLETLSGSSIYTDEKLSDPF